MQESYVGLITRRGLESFWPEYEHTSRFLERRLRRERGRSCCGYWVVIDDTAARTVRTLLTVGLTHEALLALQCLAEYFGSIVPEFLDPEVQRDHSSEY